MTVLGTSLLNGFAYPFIEKVGQVLVEGGAEDLMGEKNLEVRSLAELCARMSWAEMASPPCEVELFSKGFTAYIGIKEGRDPEHFHILCCFVFCR